jgi:hypothetical protein
MLGNSPLWGTKMVILLPYFESDRLKNGSVITLIDCLIALKQLLLSCYVNAHQHTGQCLEENQGVGRLGQSRPCLGNIKESLRKYIQCNSNDRIAEQQTLTFSLDNDTLLFLPC